MQSRPARQLQRPSSQTRHQAYGLMNDTYLAERKKQNVSVSSVPPWLNLLRAAVARPLPGLSVQMGMAPVPRPGTERILDPMLNCRRAGVLVLLYPCDGELCLVLT